MEDLNKIIEKYLDGTASEEEIQTVEKLYQSFETQEQWIKDDGSEKTITIKQEVLQKIHDKYLPEISKRKRGSLKPVLLWQKWSAAAAILILTSLFIWNNYTKHAADGIQRKESKIASNLANKNQLKLANGEIILLDTLKSGATVNDGNLKILKTKEGTLLISLANTKTKGTQWNTLSTTNGGMYKVSLPDNTQVWLNAESTLRFPSTFKENIREVTLSGEAYFEVAHEKNRPFWVTISSKATNHKNAHIEVLGTHFNVMAYEEDTELKATLLEGKVKLTNKYTAAYLLPNQQATIRNGNQSITLEKDVNISTVIAWKDGFFKFDNCPVDELMKQIGRWYNKTVSYPQGLPPHHYTGKIPRTLSIDEVAVRLQMGGIKCKVVDTEIIVYN